ncbi:MAG: endopeptidase La, partial [Rhodocyclaceae bacterium]|nr:endopeptidase La [Rhodocyclaceae bacterium]
RDRMDRLLVILGERLEVMRLSHKIDQQTRGRIDEKQREFLLREQLRTIQQELGETGEDAAGIEELADAIGTAGMSEEADRLARKELKRLARMGEGAAEYAMLRTYIEWLTELPWSVLTDDRIDIAEARRILDQDHCGLGKVKRRILEHLAVHKLNPRARSPILCFVGPPGVGKTSLGQSIARATGRRFARVSLGGVHDEAEIRGHRRTYLGALPGNIVQALRKAGSRNCVVMLDELDKLGAGIQGDPAAALLEVLDPEQNASFRDNYLGVPFDLSAVMFVGTANVLDTVPGPLRDRMEVIALPGYTEDEKAQIAGRFLVPRQREANGLAAFQCEIGDDAIHAIIGDYTREAGVRNLEREIGNVLRHSAMRIAEGAAVPVRVEAGDLAAILGPARFENEIALRTSQSGVATGLAWTPAGGDILFIEASLVPGKGRLIQTGQLGDVMKESVQAALTLVKGQASRLGVAPDLFETHDIHVHVPAGAIPKDGPSAGVAMFIALASLVTGRPVRAERAMTGEISLRGLVLPVGGIKEKVLAALRAGIATVMLPARNRKDLEEIPPDARERLRFVWLDTVEDALREALEASSPE